MNSMSGSTGRMSGKSLSRNDKIPSGYRAGQLQQFDPQQTELYNQLYGNVGPESQTARLAEGDEEAFAQMERPAMRQFNELQGGLASRFSGSGGGGSQAQLSNRRTSGFQNTSSAAASNFAQDLASRRQDLMRQARSDLFSMSHELLGQRPQEKFISKKRESEGTNWGGLAAAGIGATGGFFAGGPMGAMQGASAGYNIGSQFQ